MLEPNAIKYCLAKVPDFLTYLQCAGDSRNFF